MTTSNITRCPWPANHPLSIVYHDEEWGVPVHNDQKHFEFLLLDAFQAGLSWNTILNKRENFRLSFDAFDFIKIASYDEKKIQELIVDSGIIRNQMKIRAAISNAIAFIKIREEFGSFDSYIWRFVNHKPITNHFAVLKEVPAKTDESDAMSKDLQKRGFKFVGSTICYAYMQAAGMVNDHMVTCFRYHPLAQMM